MKGSEKKMKCMVMFQSSICDMHLGIVKFNGFLSKILLKSTDRKFLLNLTERQAHLFSNKERFKQNCTQKIENNSKGNMKLGL